LDNSGFRNLKKIKAVKQAVFHFEFHEDDEIKECVQLLGSISNRLQM